MAMVALHSPLSAIWEIPVSDGGTQVDGPFYAASKKVYPQAVHGRFRRIKWTLMIIALAVYYITPFLRWNRGDALPNQAVLVDMPARRFYFFFIEIWPQEFYYLTGLLIIAAMTLFLMNAVAGRIWCGYLCPQTIWTDVFYTIERWVEGDRRDRMKKDRQRMSLRHFGEVALKHFLWLMVAWWTGGAWVLYFADAPTLVHDLATGQAPILAYIWIGILTFMTYYFAGHMREQVCIYMCPWPRIQAALTDEWALNVTFRRDRGEPRMSLKKAEAHRAAGEPAGDCIECNQCVSVCPTGFDIRDGIQLGCVQCGLCIDACDNIMQEVGRPKGLIAYDTDINMERRAKGLAPIYRLVRARTLLYAAVIALVGSVMLYTFVTRAFLHLDVIHDRNPLSVMLSDGSMRNDYTVRIVNKRPFARTFRVEVDGLPAASLKAPEISPAGGSVLVDVPADRTREFRASLSLPASAATTTSVPLTFSVTDTKGPERAEAKDHFIPGK